LILIHPLTLGVLGVIFGSFIALVTHRWPKGMALSGRSRCDHCERQLGWKELVPLLSYFLLRGRCQTCKSAIGARQPVIEGLAMLIGISAAITFPAPHSLWIAAFGLLLLTLAIFDLEHFWLPNRIVLAVLVLGLCEMLFYAPEMTTDRLIGCAIGFLALEGIRRGYRALRHRDGMGAGDPKLLAAIAIWTGWQPLPFVLLGASVIGLIWVGVASLLGKRVDASTPLPLGTLMAGAGYTAVLISPAIAAW
jgi:leader peptidase (prepilin peptidase) / N-methyltransferase